MHFSALVIPFATLCVGSIAYSTACSSPSVRSAPASEDLAAKAPAPAEKDGIRLGYFAGGCFWGVEHFLEKLDGVVDVESGYMGGHIDKPTYKQVTRQGSGHYEAVRVKFDASKISYHDIAKRFFEIHDPTQANGQGPDIGDSYRSAVFYASPQQKKTSEDLIEQLKKKNYDVATEVLMATTFYSAEGYHQDYYTRTGKAPYCHFPVNRFD